MYDRYCAIPITSEMYRYLISFLLCMIEIILVMTSSPDLHGIYSCSAYVASV